MTTEADARNVLTGMDAVRRYALPSSLPAIHRFWLRPPEQIVVKRGFAAPANDQPGGGAEVIFVDGAPARTLYRQDTIPSGT